MQGNYSKRVLRHSGLAIDKVVENFMQHFVRYISGRGLKRIGYGKHKNVTGSLSSVWLLTRRLTIDLTWTL
jgi:hypothetical protein